MNKDKKRQPRKVKPYTDLSDLKNIHEGRKCFICGAGPSITFLDLSAIHDHVVIAVNAAMMLMPWEDGDLEGRFWISNDTLCLRWSYFWKEVLRSVCTKIVRTSWREHEDKLRKFRFRYFAPRQSQRSPLNNDGKALCFESSIPTAIDLAIFMGCKQIYLLGVDHKMAHSKSHFWQFWPKNKWPQRSDKGKDFNPEQPHQVRKFRENMRVYLALAELALREKVSIYNCSTTSIITAFPKLSLEEALL